VPLWIPEWVVRLVGRPLCRLARRHNVTCRGRRDHTVLGVGLVDPDRWGWPRR
jgi:hypothetical protein